MAKNEQSAAQRALYEKQAKAEIKRIKRFIREAEKRGYVFSDNVIPKMPKVATAATVRKYQAIRPKGLYKKAAYYDQGKKISGSKRRAEERSEAAKKSAQTRRINRTVKVLKEVQKIIAEWTPNPAWSDDLAQMKEQDKNRLENMLNGAIATEGEYAVAKRLEEKYSEVIELVYAIIYGQSKDRASAGRSGVMQNLAKFAAILHGSPLSIRESMEYTEYGETEEYEDELP